MDPVADAKRRDRNAHAAITSCTRRPVLAFEGFRFCGGVLRIAAERFAAVLSKMPFRFLKFSREKFLLAIAGKENSREKFLLAIAVRKNSREIFLMAFAVGK
ncbi:MAG: hypothetical protein EOP49_05775, partial [Sphingobacteriales bacterium]